MKLTTKYRSKLVINSFKGLIKKEDLVLDIGCGNGWIINEICKEFHCKAIGTDVLNYLEVSLPFQKMASPDTLQFNNSTFDVAIFTDVLHHAEKSDQPKLIQEALRVAKRVIIFEVKPTYLAKLIDYLINFVHNRQMNIPYNFNNAEAWIQIFKNTGSRVNFTEVQKPFYFYPIKNYLFVLERDKDNEGQK